MREYITEAVVLDRETARETDARVFLYTKELGRVMARARSAGLITSRLSGYLQPLRRVQVRLVEKNGIQIVDVLPVSTALNQSGEYVSLCQIVKSLTPEHHTDERLWSELAAVKPSILRVLMVLGFDPRHASCHQCEAKSPDFFSAQDAHYYCTRCVKSFSRTEGLYKLAKATA